MPVERTSGTMSLLDVLDRVLDRGIRFSAADRAALPSLDVDGGAARLVVVAVDPQPEASAAAPAARNLGA